MEGHNNNNPVIVANPKDDYSPGKKTSSLTALDKPKLIHEEGRIVRKAVKGHIDSADIKRSLNLQDEP